ncbi:MAG: DNA-3-methyladenine glycosylase [Saprospiraceae bacterium]
MYDRLDTAFYRSHDVLAIAQALLGKYLVTKIDGQQCAGQITEVEAYRAPDDKACHAYNHRRTPRTEIMFWPGGVAYVYLCYGIHHLFNVVTGDQDMAHAVLIRGIKPVEGISLMQQRRGLSTLKPQLTAGPGVMSKALGITTSYTGQSLLAKDSPIWIEDRGMVISADQIIATPRIGVAYAQECADWPWRFLVKDSAWVSGKK